MNLSGFPPAYRRGYADGCESVRGGSRRRDENRFQRDVDYTMGWNDGFSVCGR